MGNRPRTIRSLIVVTAAISCWLAIYQHNAELFFGLGLVGATLVWWFYRGKTAPKVAAWHEVLLAVLAIVLGTCCIVMGVGW